MTRSRTPWLRAAALAVLALAAVFALTLSADPIQDASLTAYRAGWYSNAAPRGPMTCTQTCEAKAPGTLAEYEPSADPPAKRSFLCRVQGRPSGDLRTWAYGNQFDDRPACYTVGRDLKGSYLQDFMCLCVARPRVQARPQN